MTNEEILKESIHRTHKQRRKEMASYTGPMTSDYSSLLDGIKKAEIGKATAKIAEKVVRDTFGADVLKPIKDVNKSSIDVNRSGGQELIRRLERMGLEVDDTTGNLISLKTPEISRKWSIEDLIERVSEVSEYGQRKLEEQMQITNVLSQDEEMFMTYIKSFDKYLSGNSD